MIPTKNTLALLAAASIVSTAAVAQDQPKPQVEPTTENSPGWMRVGEARDEFGQPKTSATAAPGAPAPSQLIIPAGTWIKIRVAQPIVADGYVVARRGQTIEGRVSESIKAGKAKGTSRLGVELIALSLVDGRQMPVRTQLMEYAGGTSVGRDAAAVGTATGTGAAIGAAAGGGVGAAIGAAVGAAASGIGVLTTRGRATEIYPEAEVTFRTLEPIAIDTARATQAFTPVRQEDFAPRLQQRGPTTIVRSGPAIYPYFYGGGFGGYWGNYWGSGYGWGPSLYLYSSPRFYSRGGFYRGGGHRGRR